ncbi:MAG: hypothetical protein LUE96_03410 [Lachnospiraceae bacterium]|nr:hypothetical protein [Lachnospiraceae bacterium]
MQYTRAAATEKLLESYKAYYNINLSAETQMPLRAVCEFYEHSEKFVISRNAELWSADCEEFIYLYEVEHLTKEIFEKCRDYAQNDGLQRANIGPGHMYTYITPVFVCDTCDEAARKAVKRCRIYKSFQFSLHGWMDFHVAVFEVSDNKIFTNGSGRCVGKVLKNVLFQKKFQKKRRKFL